MSDSSFLQRALRAQNDLPAEVRAMMGVYVLYWRLVETIDTMETTPPLSKAERRVLVKLECPARMGDLAREMHSTPSAVTALADGLEDKGLLTRVRDPKDRRAWHLTLTQAGATLRGAIIKEAAGLFRDLSGLSEPDIRTFAELAAKIADNILETGLPEGLKE